MTVHKSAVLVCEVIVNIRVCGFERVMRNSWFSWTFSCVINSSWLRLLLHSDNRFDQLVERAPFH